MNEWTGKGWINTRLHWNDFNIQSWHCSDPSLETFYSPPLLIICSNTATQQWRCRIISSQCFTHRNFTSSPPHRLNRVRLISDRGKRGAFSELTGSMSRAAGKKINRIITFSKRKPPLPGEPASSSGHHDNPRSGEDTDWSRSCLTDFLAGWLVSGVLNECSKVREKFGLKTYDHDYHVLWFRLVLCWKKVRMHMLDLCQYQMWRYFPPHFLPVAVLILIYAPCFPPDCREYQVSLVEKWTYYCSNSYHDSPQTEADWLLFKRKLVTGLRLMCIKHYIIHQSYKQKCIFTDFIGWYQWHADCFVHP